MPLRVRLLGPLEVTRADGVRLAPGGRRARALLALLALDAGRWVPVSRLIDGVYGTELPGAPRHAIEAQVSRLRSRGVPVEHGPAGYRLALDPDAVDVHRFTRLAAAAAPRSVDHGEVGLPAAREGRFLHDQLGSTGAAVMRSAAGAAEAVGGRQRPAGESAGEPPPAGPSAAERPPATGEGPAATTAPSVAAAAERPPTKGEGPATSAAASAVAAAERPPTKGEGPAASAAASAVAAAERPRSAGESAGEPTPAGPSAAERPAASAAASVAAAAERPRSAGESAGEPTPADLAAERPPTTREEATPSTAASVAAAAERPRSAGESAGEPTPAGPSAAERRPTTGEDPAASAAEAAAEAGSEPPPADPAAERPPTRGEGPAGEAAAERARSAGGAAAERLRAALDLWRGPALADVGEAPFAAAAAAQLEERRLTALEDLAEAELALGRHRSLAVSLISAAAEQPLRERLHGLLMRALAADGRRAEALAVFARLRERLNDELGVSPSPELVELNAALLRTPSTTASAPRPLPAQLTGFVGRAAEVVRVRELLTTGRLVTLTGPGGVGKTRLAIEAAGAAQADEVCFTDLDGVDDGASLPAVLLGALGLPAAGLFPIRTGPPDAAARLVAALADRRVLLVLDTCDRVVAELAVLLRRLLAAAPGVRVLATGREPLGLTGEQVWPVHPLPPDEAERLFRERAAAAAPSGTTAAAAADDQPDVVRRICAALDGLPLAIELAAARMRTLGPAELAARIDDRFALLSRGDRTAAPRHRTLHAVTAWSWDLLAPDEQRFAARVSVFAGGVTAATARAIEPRPDDLLAGLTEKSLLQRAGARYRMLSTVREFCAARLAAAGDAHAVHAVHARTFLELAETAEPHLRGHDQLSWLARLDAEHDDLSAALAWCAEHDPALGLRLLTALTWHGHLRGQTGERAAVAARLAVRAADRGEAYALAVATAAAGQPAPDPYLPDPNPPVPYPPVPYPPGPPRSPYLPLVRFMTEGPHAGVEFAADPWSQAFARVATALRLRHDGDRATAEKELTAAHAAFAELGDRWGRAVALEQLGALGEARALFRELGAVADLERLDGRVSDR